MLARWILRVSPLSGNEKSEPIWDVPGEPRSFPMTRDLPEKEPSAYPG